MKVTFCPSALPVGPGKQGEGAGTLRPVPVVVRAPAAAWGPRHHVWGREAPARGWPVVRAFDEEQGGKYHPLRPR